MTEEKKPKPKPPKGGRKGGAVFPRVSLKQAAEWARKLVVKTHTAAQPVDVIYSGVVGTKGGEGDVRISALRQYAYLNGDKKGGFTAADLARELVAAPPEEVTATYRKAALQPKIFKQIFDTFIGDTVSIARLRQRALDLNVHPEEADSCVSNYVETLKLAELVTVSGEQVTHVAPSAKISAQSSEPEQSDAKPDAVTEKGAADPGSDAGDSNINSRKEQGNTDPGAAAAPNDAQRIGAPKAIFNVNVTLDSSLDIEKLAKQLELLKRYGAL